MSVTLKILIVVALMIAEGIGLAMTVPRLMREEKVFILYGVVMSSFSAIVGVSFILFFLI